jgi:LDH2 family malate/lactate/ureidoglycolate dehydrogenase
MNPRLFLAGAVIGAVLGLAIGYVTHKATGGLGDFFVWINPEHFFGRFHDAMSWMIGGIVVGIAATFLRR